MTNHFNILVNKLKAFRKRYYTFQLIKGFFLTLLLLLSIFTLFSLVEYAVYFSMPVRKGLFFGFLVFSGMLIIRFILVPLLQLLQILKPIGVKESSSIIQKHFEDIRDRLINAIELSEMKDTAYSSDILAASIDQKINELNVFDFKEAVEYKNLRIILWYFFISVAVTMSVFFIDRGIFKNAPQRIVHYNTPFAKPAPFEFVLLNEELKAVKGDPFLIRVSCTGDELPQLVYINIEGHNYLMESSSPGQFSFKMESVINPLSFYFTDLKYKSAEYFLQLIPKPGINHFEIFSHPPAYTGIPFVNQSNNGDLQIPCGTEVIWNFEGIDIDTLYMILQDSVPVGAEKNASVFELKYSFYESTDYDVYIKNDVTEPELAFSYHVDVIPDLFPEIRVTGIQDSLQMTRFYFKGEIGDDYGFSALKFHYNIHESDSSVSIPLIKNLTDQEFYFSFDFADIAEASETVTYYFSVTDNDVINRYKTTTSDYNTFSFPDEEEIKENERQQFEQLEDQLKRSEQIAKEIRDDLQNLRLKNMDSDLSDWEKNQMVNDILSKQNELENLYQRIKKNNEALNDYQSSFKEQGDEIQRKQEQIEQLMEDVFTDELKKLLEEFQKLAESFDAEKLNQLTEKMDITYDDLQKQLDKNLEMLKKMKVEQMIQEVIDALYHLSGTEEKLAEEILQKQDWNEVEISFEKDRKKFNELQDDLRNALQKNEELDKPLNFDDFDEEFGVIRESMEGGAFELKNRNRRKSADQLKDAAEKTESTAFAIQQMLNSNTMEQNMENVQNLRQILSNLIYLSFEQEKIIEGLSQSDSNDPLLREYNLQQRRIKDQSQIVKDSLYALAKRTVHINSMINNELIHMEFNLDKALEEMSEGLFPQAVSSQQFVMTATNNLALLLNEALENLERQMAEGQPGDQNCERPDQGKGGLNLLKQQSENLKQQLQQMIEQMKNSGGDQMNRKMGEALMQHELMQQMLRSIMNNGTVGSSGRDALQKIDDLLEYNRKLLMNKQVNAQMIARQNDITSRLLEAEKADLEREYEDERESKTAEEFYSDPVLFFEKEKDKSSTLEYLNRNTHRLNHFYSKKYKEYLKQMEHAEEGK